MTAEIIFIDKPRGITSFRAVEIIRRKLGVKKAGRPWRASLKAGHAGTLDPFATGLLIIGIGAGTKKLEEFRNLPKTYVMDILLGRSTDTGDPEGKTTEEKKVIFSYSRELENDKSCVRINSGQLEKVLSEMEGDLELPVPLYSAVKHKGVPLYKYARRGIKVEPKSRATKIYRLKLLAVGEKYGKPVLRVEMECEKGTYARAVGEEIGRRLGVPAMLEELRRTKIGGISVESAKQLGDINPQS